MSGLGAPSRLNHFTPLRYPGGKAKLAPFIKSLISCNDLEDGWYIEPFAGGAGIALQLLLQGYVSKICINDVSLPIYAFWKSVLEQGERFAEKIETVELTIDEWDRQKAIIKAESKDDLFALGFSTFFLNRTNRSGVLNAGVIGGRAQKGEWLIDARFNRAQLAYRVRRIASLSRQIELSCKDAIDFLTGLKPWMNNKALVYADPPYYQKGRQLYYDYYSHDDHARFADFIKKEFNGLNWLVSYDDVPEVRSIYEAERMMSYVIPYSVRSSRLGGEVMFHSATLSMPIDEISGEEIGPADRFLVHV